MRELTRVAVPETENAWLQLARGKTVRQLEELVAHKSPGDDPFTSFTPTPRRHVLRFEVAPETFALFRDALTELRRQAGAALDDDSALLSMARHVLGGTGQPGRANYQIALHVCSSCGSGRQQATGQLVPVGSEIVSMARCDAQHLGSLETSANNNAKVDALREKAANTNGVLNDLDHTQHDTGSDAAGASSYGPTFDVHTNPGAHVGTTNDNHDSQAPCLDLTIHSPVESSQRSGDAADRSPVAQAHAQTGASGHARHHEVPPTVRQRATQTIPPALRRAVLQRDHGCCRVPGCNNTLYLDLHHIQLRSAGGRHVAENVISICGVHHRALHRGQLLIEGTATSPSFRHADGSEYGRVANPARSTSRPKYSPRCAGSAFERPKHEQR
jgi:5-methylcytosine-specific restriction endonuclease McrA